MLVGEVMRNVKFVHHIRRCRLREGELLKQMLPLNSGARPQPRQPRCRGARRPAQLRPGDDLQRPFHAAGARHPHSEQSAAATISVLNTLLYKSDLF
jgi:hypothetical protein